MNQLIESPFTGPSRELGSTLLRALFGIGLARNGGSDTNELSVEDARDLLSDLRTKPYHETK